MATNVLQPILSIITNIGLDHSDILGPTVAHIAAEKAGIIKPGIPVLVGETDPESAPVFTARTAECGSPLVFADRTYECTGSTLRPPLQYCTLRRIGDGATRTIAIDLLGGYQRKNLVTVRTAVSLLRHRTQLDISRRAMLDGCRNAMATTGLSGRWQVLAETPLTVADGGHNPHGMTEIVRQLNAGGYERLYMVLGFSADKELDDILPLLPGSGVLSFHTGRLAARPAGRGTRRESGTVRTARRNASGGRGSTRPRPRPRFAARHDIHRRQFLSYRGNYLK